MTAQLNERDMFDKNSLDLQEQVDQAYEDISKLSTSEEENKAFVELEKLLELLKVANEKAKNASKLLDGYDSDDYILGSKYCTGTIA